MAADFMPLEDMGRRQRTRDAEAAAEREHKVLPPSLQGPLQGLGLLRPAQGTSRHASFRMCTRVGAGGHAARCSTTKLCKGASSPAPSCPADKLLDLKKV